jgi:hypothetical protein
VSFQKEVNLCLLALVALFLLLSYYDFFLSFYFSIPYFFLPRCDVLVCVCVMIFHPRCLLVNNTELRKYTPADETQNKLPVAIFRR